MVVSPFSIFLINQKKSTLPGLWDIELKKLSNFDKIYHYTDDQLIELECEQTEEKTYELTYDGVPYAKMYDQKGMGVFEIYDK